MPWHHFNTGVFTWPLGVAVNYVTSFVFVYWIGVNWNYCYDGARDHVHLFCDGVVELGHTHACLQEEEENGIIEETIASFLWLRGSWLSEIVSAIKVHSLALLQSWWPRHHCKQPLEVAVESHVRSKSLWKCYYHIFALCVSSLCHFCAPLNRFLWNLVWSRFC